MPRKPKSLGDALGSFDIIGKSIGELLEPMEGEWPPTAPPPPARSAEDLLTESKRRRRKRRFSLEELQEGLQDVWTVETVLGTPIGIFAMGLTTISMTKQISLEEVDELVEKLKRYLINELGINDDVDPYAFLYQSEEKTKDYDPFEIIDDLVEVERLVEGRSTKLTVILPIATTLDYMGPDAASFKPLKTMVDTFLIVETFNEMRKNPGETTKTCMRCKTAPWTCRGCGKHFCEHYCSLKKNDKTAICFKCKIKNDPLAKKPRNNPANLYGLKLYALLVPKEDDSELLVGESPTIEDVFREIALQAEGRDEDYHLLFTIANDKYEAVEQMEAGSLLTDEQVDVYFDLPPGTIEKYQLEQKKKVKNNDLKSNPDGRWVYYGVQRHELPLIVNNGLQSIYNNSHGRGVFFTTNPQVALAQAGKGGQLIRFEMPEDAQQISQGPYNYNFMSRKAVARGRIEIYLKGDLNKTASWAPIGILK